MEPVDTRAVSATRLRVGVFLLFLWWIPFWALQPLLADMLGITSSQGKQELLYTVLIIQTVLGFAGLFIAGKPVASIVKSTPFKKTPAKVWHILRHGEL